MDANGLVHLSMVRLEVEAVAKPTVLDTGGKQHGFST
jgi:hypothetical protein